MDQIHQRQPSCTRKPTQGNAPTLLRYSFKRLPYYPECLMTSSLLSSLNEAYPNLSMLQALKETQKQKKFIECSHRHPNRMQGTVGFQNWEISTFSLEVACRRPLLPHGPSHMAQGSPVANYWTMYTILHAKFQ